MTTMFREVKFLLPAPLSFPKKARNEALAKRISESHKLIDWFHQFRYFLQNDKICKSEFKPRRLRALGETILGENSFKQLMACVPAPVAVIATVYADQPYGATVSSLASLSLNPPLISIALRQESLLLEIIRKSGRFSVNLLAYGQADIALNFARPGPDRFADISWTANDGLPRLTGTSAFAECRLFNEVGGGDHIILLGEVITSSISGHPALVYNARTFGANSRLIAEQKKPLMDNISALARSQ